MLLGALTFTPAAGLGQSAAETREPGADLEIFLVTVAPGTTVASRFGHSAIRVRSARTGQDRAFSFGQSNLRELSAASNLLQARLETTGSEEETGRLLERYAGQDRTVWMQRLNLLPRQRADLLRILERELGTPEGTFRYDVFRDNCTTSVRDVLDAALGGQLRAGADRASPSTYRSHVARYTTQDLALHALTTLLMSDPADQPITAWDELFLPETLRGWVRTVQITGANGVGMPLVDAEEVLVGSVGSTMPIGTTAVWRISLVIGVTLAVAFVVLGARAAEERWASTGLTLLGGGWSLATGLLGVALLALWAFGDQALIQRNENLFQVSPLSLLLALAARPSADERRRALARWLATATAGLAVLGLLLETLPGFDQRNAIVLALTVPAHLGLAVGMWRATYRAPSISRNVGITASAQSS